MSKTTSRTSARRSGRQNSIHGRNAEPAGRGEAAPVRRRAKVVFCDIGDILGDAVIVDTPPPPHLGRLDVFPFVRESLQFVRSTGYRCGIISNTGTEKAGAINAVLDRAGLLSFFEPELL